MAAILINEPSAGTVMNGEYSTSPQENEPRKSSTGWFVGLVIVVAALAIASVLIWAHSEYQRGYAKAQHEQSTWIANAFNEGYVAGQDASPSLVEPKTVTVPTPHQVVPKDPSKDPVQQGNAPVGGGKNAPANPGVSQPTKVMQPPPSTPRVNPLPPEPGTPTDSNPATGAVCAPGISNC